MATTIPVRIEAELDQPASRRTGLLAGGGALLPVGAIVLVLAIVSAGRARPESVSIDGSLGSSYREPQ